LAGGGLPRIAYVQETQQRAFMEVPMNVTLTFLFWAVFASYVVHIVDETLIEGGFVTKVRETLAADLHGTNVLFLQCGVPHDRGGV
jgi:hypothetical protein